MSDLISQTDLFISSSMAQLIGAGVVSLVIVIELLFGTD